MDTPRECLSSSSGEDLVPLKAPRFELPGVVPVGPVLAHTADTAVAVTDIRAYSGGLAFTLAVRLRDLGGFDQTASGLYRQVVSPRTWNEGEQLPFDVLQFGVQFGDGRQVTNVDEKSPAADAEGPMLVFNGLRGGDRHVDFEQWLWPLPPPGPLVFFCDWPARGITAPRYELDAERIRDAAAEARRLWPDVSE